MKDVVKQLPSISAIDAALNDGRNEDLMRQVFNKRKKPYTAKPDAHKKSAGTNQVA